MGEYLNRATERWRDGFGTCPGANNTTEAMFRVAVVTGLSPKIRDGLNTVIGLGRMSTLDWEEAITHHVNLEQDREEEDAKEDQDLKRRLLCMEVKKVTQEHNRDKKESSKGQASEFMPLGVAPPPDPNPSVQGHGPPQTQVQTPPTQTWGPQPLQYQNPQPGHWVPGQEEEVEHSGATSPIPAISAANWDTGPPATPNIDETRAP